MSLVGIDLFMILTFVAVQGLRNHLTVNLVPNPEEPITLLGVSCLWRYVLNKAAQRS